MSETTLTVAVTAAHSQAWSGWRANHSASGIPSARGRSRKTTEATPMEMIRAAISSLRTTCRRTWSRYPPKVIASPQTATTSRAL